MIKLPKPLDRVNLKKARIIILVSIVMILIVAYLQMRYGWPFVWHWRAA